MNVHDNTIYAAINVETIINLFICEDQALAQDIAKEYGENCFAINCSDYKVCLGDVYRDGKFYNGETMEEIPDSSFDFQINKLNQTMELLTNAVLDCGEMLSNLVTDGSR